MTAHVPTTSMTPAPVAAPGDRAVYRFREVFTARISNPHTRRV